MSGRLMTDTNHLEQNQQADDQSAPLWRSLDVVMGPSVLVVFYAIVGTLSTIISALAPSGGRPRSVIKVFYVMLLEFPHFVMERGMLKGIKKRVKRGGR